MADKDKKPTKDRPFPETDYPPALQRTLKAKFDRGENPSVDKDKFLGAVRRATPPTQPPDQSSDEG